jgi:hypothetical protein
MTNLIGKVIKRKRVFLVFALITGISTMAFSLSESWSSFGFEYGNFFETASDGANTAKTYMASPGINLNVYSFWNGMDVGLFVHDIFAFPQRGTLEINGNKTYVDLSVYDFIMQVGIIIGPGFRYSINDNLKLQFGIGLSFMELVGTYSQYIPYYGTVSYSQLSFNFGIGCDIGIKYDITDTFFLNIGSIITLDFASHSSISSSYGNASNLAKDYFMFGLRPYICIGFNMYRNTDNLGKPK